MALTKENMESTEKTWHPSAMWRDLARMDGWQLNRYCRGIFIDNGQFDNFPPMTRYIYYDPETFGEPMHDRAAPGPGAWLAGVHNVIAPIYRRTFRIDGVHPDFGFRDRLRSAMIDIFDDLARINKPTRADIKLVQGAVDVAMELSWKNYREPDRDEVFPNLAKATQAMLAEDQLQLDVVRPIMWGFVETFHQNERWEVALNEWQQRRLQAFTTAQA